MYVTPNIDRLKRIDIAGIKQGSQILFCPDCNYQITGVGMKPVCPECRSYLNTTTLDSDLIILNMETK